MLVHPHTGVPFNAAHTIDFAVIKNTAQDPVMFTRLAAVVDQSVIDQVLAKRVLTFVEHCFEVWHGDNNTIECLFCACHVSRMSLGCLYSLALIHCSTRLRSLRGK